MVRSGVEANLRRHDLEAMGPGELLAEAVAGGLAVFANGDRLVVRGPRTSEIDLVQTLVRRKGELMALLGMDQDDRDHFEERAAIGEFDAGLSRAEAEQLALAQVQAPLGVPRA